MDEKIFWAMIEKSKYTMKPNQLLVNELCTMRVSDIIKFDEISRMFIVRLLHTTSRYNELKESLRHIYKTPNPILERTFIEFVAWVVSRGEKFYEDIYKNRMNTDYLKTVLDRNHLASNPHFLDIEEAAYRQKRRQCLEENGQDPDRMFLLMVEDYHHAVQTFSTK